MPKVQSKLHVVTLDKSGEVLSDEFLPEKDAFERFSFLIQCHLTIGFESARVFRLVGGNHILYEFRDIRSIVNQHSIDNYFSLYLKP